MAWQSLGLQVLLSSALVAAYVPNWKTIPTLQGDEWREINDTELSRMYPSGKWGDGDDSEGDAVTEVGKATIDHDFAEGYTTDLPPGAWITGGLDVECSDDHFIINIPSSFPIIEVKVVGTGTKLPIVAAPKSCGYYVSSYQNVLNVPFSGCHVKQQTGRYVLQLQYINERGRSANATVSCNASPEMPSSDKLIPKSPRALPSKCPSTTTGTTTGTAQNCMIPSGEQLRCGTSGISAEACASMGCCVHATTSACYYPMDECTADKYFVFAIRKNSASNTVDTHKLAIPGSPNCRPAFVDSEVALFKFSVTECGVHAYEIGNTVIYIAEVHTAIDVLNLKYGSVSRGSPLRFIVECRYAKTSPSGVHTSMASIGYLVSIPALNFLSGVTSTGLFGVELRLAQDSTYTEYHTSDNLPLRLLLGTPVYLELNLKSPRPRAVLLVNYCIAFPRSAKNALVLIYEGCANPYDTTVSILKVSDLPTNRNQRRFVVDAFQFMDQVTNKYLDEIIYFMCSTEVCFPIEHDCPQRCFDG